MAHLNTRSALVRKFQFALLASVTAVLVACGGGSTDPVSLVSNSAATPASSEIVPTFSSAVDAGINQGTGAVVINGTQYDDSQAQVVELAENGSYKHFDGGLGYGHSVQGYHGGKHGGSGYYQLDTLVVERSIRGPVTAISATGFTVMGQTVTISTTAGAATAFGGNAATLADIAVGDWVSVYGTRVAATAALAATRVDEQTSPLGDKAQLSGSITDVTATGFKIGGLSVTYAAVNLYPANTTLVAGNRVTVWVSKSATANAVTADKVVLYVPRWSNNTAAWAAKANVNGLVSNLNTTAKTFTAAGVTVNYSALTAPASLLNGALANVQGTINADGSVSASYLNAQSATVLPTYVRGLITDFVSVSNFKVRGVSVDATGITVTPSNCVLANAIEAEIDGTIDSATGKVKAAYVHCPGVQPPNSTRIVTINGPVTAVNATAKTFTLTDTARGAVTVSWDARTRFTQGVTAATLGTNTTALQMDVVSKTDAAGKVTSMSARLIGTNLNRY